MKILKMRNLYSLIYISVIITLFFLYFSGKDVTYYQIENLYITETASIEFPLIPKKTKSLTINYKDLNLTISQQSPIKIISGDNIQRNATVESMSIVGNSLNLNLKNQLELNIMIDKRGNRLTISSTIPKVFPAIKEIILPYELSSNLKLEPGDLSYKIFNDQEEFHLKLNDLYYVDTEKSQIHLIAEDDKINTLTFSPLSDSDLPLAEQWYNTIGVHNSIDMYDLIEDYLTDITEYNNDLYNSIRYSSSSGTWSNLPGISEVTEESVVIYLADALESGNYSSSKLKIDGLLRLYPYKFGFYSTPYLGNIIRNGRDGLDLDAKELYNIRRLVDNSDQELLNTWIADHYFTAGSIDLKKLEIFISDVELDSSPLITELILLNNLLYILDGGSTNSSTLDMVKQLTDSIIEKIYWDETGLHLIDTDGLSNMTQNLRAGQLLIKASQHESSEYSKPIGESLISTYINNSEENGALKGIYLSKEKRWLERIITPETSYLALSNNPYLPHYHEEGGLRIWTISDSIDVTRTSSNIRITASFPIDREKGVRSHYLAISGVEPYKELYFRGTLWRADRNFEKWGVGYFYDQTPQHLYFMPKHNKIREEILISY